MNGNNRPFAGDDFACTIFNVPVTGNWRNSDYDNDGDNFEMQGTSMNLSSESDNPPLYSYSTRKGGEIAFYDDGTFIYNPLEDYYGPDQYRYQICDDGIPQECDSATIYLVVNPIRRDFGDHPALYPTASHHISLDENGDNMPDVPGTFWLGSLVDGEITSKFTTNADGDDLDDLSDEDGLLFNRGALLGSEFPLEIVINSNQSGIQVYFGLWIDWDGNGTYEDYYTDYGISSSPDTVIVNINIPATIPTGMAHFRLRAFGSPPSPTDFTGHFRNGEIEDYRFYTYNGPGGILLPVEMISFSAIAVGSNALLEWQTASEINNDFFEVQRSTDAINWEFVDIVEGHGNSDEIHYYDCIDKHLQPNTYYYRLKQFDYDGSYEFSNVEAVIIKGNESSKISISPNPAHIMSKLVIDGLGEDITDLRLLDYNGRVVANIILDNGFIDLSCYDLHPGMYLIQVITTNSAPELIKLVVIE